MDHISEQQENGKRSKLGIAFCALALVAAAPLAVQLGADGSVLPGEQAGGETERDNKVLSAMYYSLKINEALLNGRQDGIAAYAAQIDEHLSGLEDSRFAAAAERWETVKAGLQGEPTAASRDVQAFLQVLNGLLSQPGKMARAEHEF